MAVGVRRRARQKIEPLRQGNSNLLKKRDGMPIRYPGEVATMGGTMEKITCVGVGDRDGRYLAWGERKKGRCRQITGDTVHISLEARRCLSATEEAPPAEEAREGSDDVE
jgi:hypothetical protein